MDEHQSNAEPYKSEVTRRTVIETGATALLLTTLPRAALAAGPAAASTLQGPMSDWIPMVPPRCEWQ
jgi:hypothetical protein